MSRRRYDSIVVGVGAMGSATAYQLAKRGERVLGLEQHDIPNQRGSSHGGSRVFSSAYYSEPAYHALNDRAIDLWNRLEANQDEQLLRSTGWLSMGDPDHELVNSTRENCDRFSLSADVLSSSTIADRFPGYDLPDGYIGVYQHEAGLLYPHRCITALVNAALANGAEIHGREPVTGWTETGGGIVVETEHEEYEADRMVVTAGAWAMDVLPVDDLAVPEPQLMAWFQPTTTDHFSPDRFPPGSIGTPDGVYSAFPPLGRPGVKAARFFTIDEPVDPTTFDRTPRADDEAELRRFVREYVPAGSGPTLSLQTCLFTVSPDESFIIDTHPATDSVVFAAGFSGHGFSFAPVVGEVLADLALTGSTEYDIEPFRLDRFESVE